MPRLCAIVATPLALVAVACASDDTGPTVTQTGAAASPTVEATPIEYAQAVRAVAAPDQEAYRLSIVGRGFVQATCSYDAGENVVSCEQFGFFYVLEPPPTDGDVACVAGLPAAGGNPEFVLCNAAGRESKFYIIENVTAIPEAS